MKKTILNLGTSISKNEQKEIKGGLRHFLGNECNTDYDCLLIAEQGSGVKCCSGSCIITPAPIYLEGLTCA
ncbi:hypothetical protein [uncultured Tenacibaculum sp.]|uniref:hypothetical protein n=1 Tax=uncultured Tenacibaculum sp. TaxID=174713 RepID=UPI00262FDCB2|nr:hypothetical protein [uncultured Tenacibaculum sp.]